jgi:hypothetical protein
MDKSSAMQLTIFLFHLETCCSFVFGLAGIIICTFGFLRTRLWGFLALVFAGVVHAVQLALHYYYFLRSYELPPALKITGTFLFFLGSILGLVGTLSIAVMARRRHQPSNQAMQRTAPRSDA